MKYVKILPGMKFEKASRDKREISAIQELGFEVTIISSDISIPANYSNCVFVNDGINNNDYKKMSKFVRWKHIISNWMRLIKIVSNTSADFISGHDLLAVLIAYFSSIGKKQKPFLIYDSHELEMGRNSNRKKLMNYLVINAERFIAQKCDLIIIPCEEAARILKEKYLLKKIPLVIRSTPERWDFDKKDVEAKRLTIRKQLNIPNDAFVICYHGNIVKDRGIEDLISAVSNNDSIYGLILGDVQNMHYGELLHDLCNNLQVGDRVVFHEAVPFDNLWEYLVAVDVGIAMIQPTCLSYYLALPNKLFENIQALNPIIASNLPEIAKCIEKYDIGILIDNNDKVKFCQAVKSLQTDRVELNRLKKNLTEAKNELCWEVEKNKFKQSILSLIKQ